MSLALAPSLPKEHAAIPVINISPSNPNAPAQLLDAAARHGFVFVENDNSIIPSSAIDHMFDLSRQFFSSPIEEKEPVSIASNKAGKNHGWLNRGVEMLDPGKQVRADVKEAFNIGEPVPAHNSLSRPALHSPTQTLQQPLPPSLSPHTPTILSFQSSCHALCTHLLTLFASALAIPPDWFTSRHDPSLGPSGTVFRLLYYPRIDSTYEHGVDIRAGAHSDFGSLTLLFQRRGEPGLEILDRGNEEGEQEEVWLPVPTDPIPQPSDANAPLPILVNIGDLLEDWTSGLLKSTVHRVVFPSNQQSDTFDTCGTKKDDARTGDRYSMAYFCHPLDHVRLERVPSRVVEEYAERNAAAVAAGSKTSRRNGASAEGREKMTARDHLMERLGATYSI